MSGYLLVPGGTTLNGLGMEVSQSVQPVYETLIEYFNGHESPAPPMHLNKVSSRKLNLTSGAPIS